MSLLNWLKIPETQVITDLDSIETTLLHRRILQHKSFLKNVYRDFYEELRPYIDPNANANVLEIGSGAGFLKNIFPNVITSEILQIPDIDLCCSGSALPFQNNSLDGIFLIDTLHHIPNSLNFFSEAQRCLRQGGYVGMVEPANTPFARFIYQNFHHEEFDPTAKDWSFMSHGPLSSANGALPWIIFQRDRQKFEEIFPQFQILKYDNHTPLKYLLSGGFTLKQLVPSWSYNFFKGMEWILNPLNSRIGLFTTIIIQKN